MNTEFHRVGNDFYFLKTHPSVFPFVGVGFVGGEDGRKWEVNHSTSFDVVLLKENKRFKCQNMVQLIKKSAFFCLFYLLFCSQLSAQNTTIARRVACIDDEMTISKSEFPCASANQSAVLSPSTNCAVLRSANGSIRIQFTQVGEVKITVNCTSTTSESIVIKVEDCETDKCIGENLIPNPSFETFGNCNTALRGVSLTDIVLPWVDCYFPIIPYGSSDYMNRFVVAHLLLLTVWQVPTKPERVMVSLDNMCF